MTGPSKRKGDRGELELAAILTSLLGTKVQRLLGAGRKADVGDLHGVPDTVVQVANWDDVSAAAIRKPREAEAQRGHAGAGHAVTFVRFRGGHWRAILTPEQWARYYDGSTRMIVDTT